MLQFRASQDECLELLQANGWCHGTASLQDKALEVGTLDKHVCKLTAPDRNLLCGVGGEDEAIVLVVLKRIYILVQLLLLLQELETFAARHSANLPL